MPQAVSLARQSKARDEQEESVSIAFQHRVNREEARRRDDEITVEFEDVDVSGHGDSRTKREGLHAMLAYLRVHPQIRTVYIYNVSRLARDTYFMLEMVRELRNLKPPVELRSSSENIEDPTILTVLGAFAERERTQLSNAVAYAVREQAQRGLVTQQPPFGYARTDGILYPVEPDASIVKRIFREFVEGRSTQQIIDGLTAEHIPSSYGKPHWRGKAIRAMLRRRTYVGQIEISETRDPSGKVRPYLLTRGLHEPLIDVDTWELVQRKLSASGWSRSAGGRINPWLAERSFCSGCGKRIYFGVKSRRTKEQFEPAKEQFDPGEIRWYAKCSTAQLASDKRAPNTCPGQQSADLHLIEPIARMALYNRLRRIATPDEAYEAARAHNARQGGNRRVELATRLESAKRESAELLRLKLKHELTDDEWHTNRERLESIIAHSTLELEAIPQEMPITTFARAHHRVADYAIAVSAMTDDDLRTLLLTLDARVTLDLREKRAAWRFGDAYAYLLAD